LFFAAHANAPHWSRKLVRVPEMCEPSYPNAIPKGSLERIAAAGWMWTYSGLRVVVPFGQWACDALESSFQAFRTWRTGPKLFTQPAQHASVFSEFGKLTPDFEKMRVVEFPHMFVFIFDRCYVVDDHPAVSSSAEQAQISAVSKKLMKWNSTDSALRVSYKKRTINGSGGTMAIPGTFHSHRPSVPTLSVAAQR
jgi:hypothetical protein